VQLSAEMLLTDALGAIRTGQLGRARELLDRYVAHPEAKDKDQADHLRRELIVSTSAADATELAKKLSDQELRSHLRNGVQAIVEKIGTQALRPYYQNTLMMALRQESTRRQMVSRQAIAQRAELVRQRPEQGQRADPRVAQAGKPSPRTTLLPNRNRASDLRDGHGDDRAEARREEPIPAIPADIDQVFSSPTKYRGKTLSLNGLFKIGTRISEVKDSEGQVVGLSIPVARDDDRTICTGDRKIGGYDLYLILDDQIAQALRRVFEALKLRPMVKPTYRTILEVSVRELPNANKSPRVIVITSLEILGMCDYLRVARYEYEESFRVVEVKAAGGEMHFGDGSKWVERLGGEEKFVQPVRRKLREIQRRWATDARQAVMDSVYLRELSKAMQLANAYHAIVAMETENWRRLLVSRAGLP